VRFATISTTKYTHLDHSQHYLKVVKGSYTERDYYGSRDPTNKKVLDFINAL
jgi:hypothetical protein